MLTEQKVKQGVMEGLMPSEAWDMACKSHTGMVGDPFTQTEQKSTNIFALVDGHPNPTTNIAKL